MVRCAVDVLYISQKPSLPVIYLTFYFIVLRRGNLRKYFYLLNQIRDSVSSKYQKAEERVDNENCVTASGLKLSQGITCSKSNNLIIIQR